MTFATARELLTALSQAYSESRADTTGQPKATPQPATPTAPAKTAKERGEAWVAAEGITDEARKTFAVRRKIERTWEAFMAAIETTEGACELRVINWSKRNGFVMVNVEAYMKQQHLRSFADFWDQIEANEDDQINAIRNS
ncbi:MAG: hypothetical protein H0X24_24810 [Ktedonobacterales bacterium]|nr:hypothetical protein [Ktedonobacterales bacterium]